MNIGIYNTKETMEQNGEEKIGKEDELLQVVIIASCYYTMITGSTYYYSDLPLATMIIRKNYVCLSSSFGYPGFRVA